MKAMLMSDILTARKYFRSQLLIVLVVSVFIAITMNTPHVIVPVFTCGIPFSIAFTLMAFDERNDWQKFRLALPLSRKNIMTGRYASFALITGAGLVVGIVVMVLVVLLGYALPSIPVIANLSADFGWQPLMLTSALSIALMLIMLAVALPLVARFGMTRAVRFIPLLALFLVVAFGALSENDMMPEYVASLTNWISTDAGTIGVSLIALGVTALLYAISCVVSIKLYEKREF